MSSLYVDLPLDKPDKQIRLLRLEPNDSLEDIVCSLTVHDFGTDCPNYIAISYTWGDSLPNSTIVVNGARVRVRVHCWHALWQMRCHGSNNNIWIDSLCINQSDDGEKNVQVGMMGAIYQSAQFVAACLGLGYAATLSQLRKASDGITNRAAIVACVREFDQIPYFNRIWIKQELILARRIIFFCGTEAMPWEDFEMALEKVLEAQPAMEDEDDDSESEDESDSENEVQQEPGSNIYEALARARQSAHEIEHDSNERAESENDVGSENEGGLEDEVKSEGGLESQEEIGSDSKNTISWNSSNLSSSTGEEEVAAGDIPMTTRIRPLLKHRRARIEHQHGKGADGVTLLKLLTRYGNARCTDPRDKVYALLSLLPDDSVAREQLSIDYGQPSFDFFRQVSLFFCNLHRYNDAQGGKYNFNILDILSRLLRWLVIDSTDERSSAFLQARVQSSLLASANTLVKHERQYIELAINNFQVLSLVQDEDKWRQQLAVHVNHAHEDQLFVPALLTESMSLADTAAFETWGCREALSTLPRDGIERLRLAISIDWKEAEYTTDVLRVKHNPLLLSGDAKPSDIIARVRWTKTRELYPESSRKRPGNSSYAVLRQQENTSTWELHSWALPLPVVKWNRKQQCWKNAPNTDMGWSGAHEPWRISRYADYWDPSMWDDNGYCLGELPYRSNTLYLHRDDLLSFTLMDQEPMLAFGHAATTSTCASHAVLGDHAEKNVARWKRNIEDDMIHIGCNEKWAEEVERRSRLYQFARMYKK